MPNGKKTIDLLPRSSEKVHYYKANLHSHSTLSDGHLTPREMKERYMQKGYSIIAFTDHEGLFCHNDLTDENFLSLTGTEIAIRGDLAIPYRLRHDIHINLIAKSPDMKVTPFYNDKYVKSTWGFTRKDLIIDENEPPEERVYSAQYVNSVIKRAHEAGFLVYHNHPSDSPERYTDYCDYVGFDGLEIRNGVSYAAGCRDSDYAYDDYLMAGKRLIALACDDNHNGGADNTPRSGEYRAYTKIFAEKLSYSDIISALEAGHCYAGTGDYYGQSPDILYLGFDSETLTVKIETAPAKRINLFSGVHYSAVRCAEFGGYITEAEFKLYENTDYFRIEVTGENGYKTFTSGYFVSDLKIQSQKE